MADPAEPAPRVIAGQNSARVARGRDKGRLRPLLIILAVLILTVGAGALRVALRDDPEVGLALRGGAAAMDRGRYAEALAAYADALRRRPADERAQLGVAVAKVLANPPPPGELRAVAGRLEALRATHPSDPHLPLALARLAQIGGDPARARGHYEEALRLKEDLPEAWFELGTLAEAEGARAQARKAYARAVQLAPEQRRYLAALAAQLMALGDFEEALQRYEQLLRMDQSMLLGRLDAGNAARLAGNLTTAGAHQERLVEDLAQQGALVLPVNAAPWAFAATGGKVVLQTAEAKRAYALLDAALTRWLADDRDGAAQAMRQAQGLGVQDRARAILDEDIRRLGSARPEWLGKLAAFAAAYPPSGARP